MKKRLVCLMTTVLLAASCGKPIPELPELGGVNAIYITVHGDGLRPIAEITDPSRIAEIVAFVNARRTGWSMPWYGVPIPAVTAQFCDGDKFKGHFGAGANFFETDLGCTFCSRYAFANEVKTFLNLLQVDARYLDWDFKDPGAQDVAGTSEEDHLEVCGRPL